ncbi:DUF3017 domain-containing protein [Nocardioides sp.]|uniref:DUF3017 domain-containing protein n=1 Tax=Nocardioides sp. TaxID=35761 RepID=UPI0039E2CC3A
MDDTEATPEESGRPSAPDVEEERRYPSTIGGACYLVILAAVAAALVVVAAGHWRTGVHILAVALIVAALLRLILRQRDAGMLAVRGRFLDAGLLLVVGGALYVLATTIPNQV